MPYCVEKMAVVNPLKDEIVCDQVIDSVTSRNKMSKAEKMKNFLITVLLLKLTSFFHTHDLLIIHGTVFILLRSNFITGKKNYNPSLLLLVLYI